MIIDGAVYLEVSINNFENSLKPEEILVFTIKETTGCYAPQANLVIRTLDETVATQALVAKTLTVKIGNIDSNPEIIQLHVIASEPQHMENGYQYFNITALTSPERFLLERKTEAYEDSNSLEVVKSFCRNYLSISDLLEPTAASTITSVNERRVTWRRALEVGNIFLADTITHMDIRPSFPVSALTRNNNIILKSFEELKKEQPRIVFTPRSDVGIGEAQYLNSFTPKTTGYVYDNFSGNGKLNLIENSDKGSYEALYEVRENELSNSTSTGINQGTAGASTRVGSINNNNVHDTYSECAIHNGNKFVEMTSVEGKVTCVGRYFNNIHPSMLVSIETPEKKENSGKYLIGSVEITYKLGGNIITEFTLIRDSFNNLENGEAEGSGNDVIRYSKIDVNKIVAAIRNSRIILAKLTGLLVKYEIDEFNVYLSKIKYGILTNFDIYGTKLNFNNKIETINSIKLTGNSIVNYIIDRLIPVPYNYALTDVALNPSLLIRFADVITQFIPTRYNSLFNQLLSLVSDIEILLESIEGDNNQRYLQEEVSTNYYNKYDIVVSDNGETVELGDKMREDNAEKQVQEVLNDMVQNTEGVDLPFPIIVLTDNEKLLDNTKITQLVVDRTIEELESKGYLEGIDNMREILLGEESLDFNTIDKINSNVGTVMYTRFWGTYDNLEQLTDFYVTDSFEDKYKTVLVTKFINASGGKKIFFALPKKEDNVVFFINSKEVDLEHIEMFLGYRDSYGNNTPYNVYYTKEVYNSNSTIFECRKRDI